MSELRYPEWQKPYDDALLELNPEKLVQRVNEADSRMEAQAIEDALNALRVLKNETAKFKRSQNAGAHCNTIGAESD
jgi:hypothetical protein